MQKNIQTIILHVLQLLKKDRKSKTKRCKKKSACKDSKKKKKKFSKDDGLLLIPEIVVHMYTNSNKTEFFSITFYRTNYSQKQGASFLTSV